MTSKCDTISSLLKQYKIKCVKFLVEILPPTNVTVAKNGFHLFAVHNNTGQKVAL